MGKILQDIWILTASGTTIWSRVFNPKINEQLFGALMNAIDTFAKETVEEGISNFELNNKKYVIIKKEDTMFVTNVKKGIKQKNIRKELHRIAEKFFNTYSDELDRIKSDGDIDLSLFSNFEDYINSSLEDTIDKFQKAFW